MTHRLTVTMRVPVVGLDREETGKVAEKGRFDVFPQPHVACLESSLVAG